jgi:tRNA pseudouridine55 synthase
MDGILLIDKSENINSHHVVVRLRYAFDLPSIGHGGTLDPLATGVLVILIGRAVKLSEYVIGHDKTYRVVGVFGQMRDTFDAHGRVTQTHDRVVTRTEMEETLAAFPRAYDQMPPAYSAKKIRGVAAYKRARSGQKPVLFARGVRITELSLLNFTFPRFELHATVSAGTYIRSLVVDIAARLQTLAYVDQLNRLTSGPFRLENARPLDQVLTWSKETLAERILPMEAGVLDLPAVELPEDPAKRFVCGQWIPVREIPGGQSYLFEIPSEKRHLFRVRAAGHLIALGFFEEGYLKHERVLLRW